ncbi:hypothetical protein FWH58_01040 [Candidatus Saccharibacteria bacterium]|nr:hypothetical protein [Candidatus Saccharibacteria bacterium]
MEISNEIMQIWLPLVVAGLAQASFSLGVSMLTLLSGHLLAAPESTRRLHRLSLAYIVGSLLTITTLLLALMYLLDWFSMTSGEQFWAILTGASVGVGLCVILFYYRRDKKGTRLWLPRPMAEYLYMRIKNTRRAFEAFVLGIGAIVAELIFIAAPLIIAANLLLELTGWAQIIAVKLYLLIAISPLIILFISNFRGRKISKFQSWRERQKRFLQIAAGALLIILGFYLLTYKSLGG